MTLPQLKFPVRDWSGSISLIQGLKWAGRDFFVYQADNVGGSSAQNVIIRRYGPDLTYKGFMTVIAAGHASSTGVVPINESTTRHLISADARGIRAVDYVIGQKGKTRDVYLSGTGFCSAVSVNNEANRISARTGGAKQTIKWFDRDKILSGAKTDPLFKFSFPTPSGMVFQGHYNFGDSDFFHWESSNQQRGAKNYRCFAQRWQNGKLVSQLDTRPFQPEGEPEGFMGYNGSLYFVKRVGGLNRAKRYVLAVPTNF